MPELLVIGWGNPLRQDDGAGFRAASALGGIAVQQLTPDLAFDMAGAERVLFIDSDHTLPAGEWRVEPLEANTPCAASTHSASAAAIVRLSALLYGARPECRLLRIGGEYYGHGADLSPAVARALEEVIRYVREAAASSG